MPKEAIVWQALIFGTILLVSLGAVIISFVFFYQRRRYLHRQEVTQMQETFTKEMLHSKNEIQEQTLRHIAAEIHDNFNPTLSVINLNLAEVIPSVEEPVKETISDTKILVKQLMAEMRALSSSLNSDHISRIGFTRAFEKFVDHLRKTGVYNITLSKSGDEYRLPADKEIILLRMCQEILNNIVKHADARNIDIHVTYKSSSYGIEIKDDGKGFDETAVGNNPDKQDTSGLRNLRNRADVIEAELIIKSKPGSGTAIIINLPI
jgi:signal transduction histidine kinase